MVFGKDSFDIGRVEWNLWAGEGFFVSHCGLFGCLVFSTHVFLTRDLYPCFHEAKPCFISVPWWGLWLKCWHVQSYKNSWSVRHSGHTILLMTETHALCRTIALALWTSMTPHPKRAPSSSHIPPSTLFIFLSLPHKAQLGHCEQVPVSSTLVNERSMCPSKLYCSTCRW